MEFQPLKYIYRPADKINADTLLLLHGTGGDENDLLPLAKYFGSDYNILSLRGNVSEQGMPRFFKRLGMGIFDEQDLAYRTHEMVAFIKTLAEEKGFDTGRIIALGYSNGANIIGSTLFLYPDFFKAAIMYRPMQPFKALPEVKGSGRTRVFMSNGLEDPTIRPQDTERYIQALQDAGFAPAHFQFHTGHNLSQDDLKQSVEWLKSI